MRNPNSIPCIKFYFGIWMLSFIISFGGVALAAADLGNDRELEITYLGVVQEIPTTTQQVGIWVPLASSRDGQTIVEREISAPTPYEITRDLRYENEMVHFLVQPPIPNTFRFEIKYHAVIGGQTPADSLSSDSRGKFLEPSRLMIVDEQVRQFSETATLGRNDTIQKSRGIYDFVLQHMKYDKTIPGWGRGDTARACRIGAGNCTDFHSLFISLALAARIPARFKIGVTVPEDQEGAIPGYHCWAEFYDDKTGWQAIDASEAWKHPEKKEQYFRGFDVHKFLVSVGRDIELVPKQKGEPLNFFFYPYVEVNGQPFAEIKTAVHYKNLKG